MAVDAGLIGETTAQLMDDVDDEQHPPDAHIRRVIVVIELESAEEGSAIGFHCSDEDPTAQAGLLARALNLAVET